MGGHSGRSAGGRPRRARETPASLGEAVIAGVRAGCTSRALIEAHPSLWTHLTHIDQCRRLFPQPHDATRPFQTMWIYGPTGTGKTSYVSALFRGSVFRATLRQPFLNSYAGEDVIVFDDVTSSHHMHHTEDFIHLCDPRTSSWRILFRDVPLVHHALVFTSNYTPNDVFDQMRLPMMHRRIHVILHVPVRDTVISQQWELATHRFVDDPVQHVAPPHPDSV